MIPPELNKVIEQIKEDLQNVKNNEEKIKEVIVKYMNDFEKSDKPINSETAQSVLRFLENIKDSLILCDEIVSSADKNINNTSKLKELIQLISESPETQSSVDTSTQSDSEKQKVSVNHTQKVSEVLENEINISDNSLENTLLVSEKTGKVILPYDHESLNEILQDKSNGYNNIDEIISDMYTVPIKKYKNPFISRFKEGYKLIREREQGSIREGIDLGVELMFNYNLHPAIISACNNLDELDMYLDYLDSGKTSSFKCFKIIFEFPPAISNKKRNDFDF